MIYVLRRENTKRNVGGSYLFSSRFLFGKIVSFVAGLDFPKIGGMDALVMV